MRRIIGVGILGAVCFCGTVSVASFPQARPEAQPDERKIQVKLSFVSTSVSVGAPVLMKVEITNTGNQTLFLPSRIPVNSSGFPANLQLRFQDARGKELSRIMGALDRLKPPAGDFYKLVLENWVAIPAHYTFGTIVNISSMLEGVGPGRYKLGGTYSVESMRAAHMNNPLGAHLDEIPSLPYPAWEGVFECAPIWINITARGPQ